MTNKKSAAYDTIDWIPRLEQEKFSWLNSSKFAGVSWTPKIHFHGMALAQKTEPIAICYAHIQLHRVMPFNDF
ncbi:MAG: hypothetical protein GX565_03485 [Lentisphaerae bacterium]|nr:hypothetical protein [Lentisphaerota bacterium]